MTLADRAKILEGRTPDIVADVMLYATDDGGRRQPILPGYGCVCVASKSEPPRGYDALFLLGNNSLLPGQRRKLGMVFLTPEGADAMRAAGNFYLWEAGFIGEATVIAADRDADTLV